MKYMLLVYTEEDSWTKAEREESARLCQDLASRGQYLSAHPLQSVTTATTLRIRNGKLVIMDGPFAETREQLGGYFVVEADDLNEALRIAARIPGARKGAIEIRPVMDVAGLPSKGNQEQMVYSGGGSTGG